MSAAVSAILEGMPEPRDLRMREHDGRCVITAGQVVLFEYAAGDIVMRNIALAALRQLGFRGRVVAAALGLTENYVATLHNAAKRDGSAALIRQVLTARLSGQQVMINGNALYPPSPVGAPTQERGEDERPGRRQECRRSAGSARWRLRRRCGGHHRR